MNILQRLLPRRTFADPMHQRPAYPVHPDTPLLHLNRAGDAFRLRDAYEGIAVFGGTGSGKSSGSGKAIRHAMLRLGFGALVLCAKPGEAETWIADAIAAGREADLLVMRPEGRLTFNFLEYEMRRPDGAGRDVFNLVALIEVVLDAFGKALAQGTGGGEEAFWLASRRQILTKTIEPLIAATGECRIEDIMRFITSAPLSLEQVRSEEWAQQSFCYQVLAKSHDCPIGPPLPMHAVRATADYWFYEFAGLDPKTRSGIVITLTSALSVFQHGLAHELFCDTTTIIPELTHEGAILIVDIPIKQYGPLAVVAGQIMKYAWQKATERRPVYSDTRPVGLYVDEAQFFLSQYDAEFQSTARSSRAATVYLTQNLPTYYAQLPGRDPKFAADSLLGNFQTKIFHANTDEVTNRYAAEMVGKTLQRRTGASWSATEGWQHGSSTSDSWNYQLGTSRGKQWGGSNNTGHTVGSNGQYSSNGGTGSNWGGQTGTSRSRSWGGGASQTEGQNVGFTDGGSWSEQMDYTIQPVVFASGLRKGGQSDEWMVDAVVVQGGRRFAATGQHWLPATFQQ